MNADLRAKYYADAMVSATTEIVENEAVAEDTYRVRVVAPEIARGAVPGQFVMLRMHGVDSPLIGRALAVYNVVGASRDEPTMIDLVYIRKGRLTQPLSTAPVGAEIAVWGPLGNGFSPTPCDHLIIAVGGIGQTPMLMLAEEALGNRSFGSRPTGYAGRVTMIYGARRASLLAGVEDFQRTGMDVRLCSDDGSVGTHARVPEVLEDTLAEVGDDAKVRVVTCGPEIMMQRVAELCGDRRVPCEVSMETPMACGIGICFSCVAKVRQADGQWDYKRTCVEGPIFDAEKIVWD